jgi:hypothetical protein
LKDIEGKECLFSSACPLHDDVINLTAFLRPALFHHFPMMWCVSDVILNLMVVGCYYGEKEYKCKESQNKIQTLTCKYVKVKSWSAGATYLHYVPTYIWSECYKTQSTILNQWLHLNCLQFIIRDKEGTFPFIIKSTRFYFNFTRFVDLNLRLCTLLWLITARLV